MKLLYRGSSYQSHAQVETVGTTIIAQFRGLSYQVRRALLKDDTQPKMNLKYRGIPYTFNKYSAIARESPLETKQSNRYKPIA